MKYEWRKMEKDLYLPKNQVVEIQVPKFVYITIEGKGNPNHPDFAARVEALYAIAYGIRMAPKSGYMIQDYYDYTVYPLEGVWDSDDLQDLNNKDAYKYKIMIRQPAFVDKKVFDDIKERVKVKKKMELLDSVQWEEIEDGRCIQMMHVGAFDDEIYSFQKMKEYLIEKGLKQRLFTHREIYLSDPRKSDPSKMKTVLRYFLTD